MLKNIIYLLSVQGGNYIFPLVTLPYLVRILEPTGYGIYGYSFAVVQYFILFIDYGFNYSAPKIISISRENTDSISKVFWNVTFIKIIAASLGLLIIYLISELNIIDYQIKFIILAYISVVGNLIYPVWFFQGLEKMEKMLSVIEKMPKSLFNGERFLTDEELSKVLRVSRRTLQEYRTFGVVPYYMVQGKTLYKESDILKILEDSYKRCREEQRWV